MHDQPAAFETEATKAALSSRASAARHDELSPEGGRRMAAELSSVIRWIVGERRPDSEALRMSGRRVVMMLWLLDPAAFPGFRGEPVSIAKLARALRASPEELRRTADEITRQFVSLSHPRESSFSLCPGGAAMAQASLRAKKNPNVP